MTAEGRWMGAIFEPPPGGFELTAPVKLWKSYVAVQQSELWADPGSSYGPLACKTNALALSYEASLLQIDFYTRFIKTTNFLFSSLDFRGLGMY